jgi:succinyl-diaminopimelate desuccinylase
VTDSYLLQEVVELARALVRRPSVSPADGGCQDLLADRLSAAGYQIERLDFGATRNLFAYPTDGPIRLLMNGHTDVVPPGQGWTRDPWSGEDDQRFLFGRGSADMKSGVAAMVVALGRLSRAGRADGLGLLLTSDEEGSGEDGTRRALEALLDRGVEISAAFVAEPTSVATFGDCYKPGRRGSVTLRVQVPGQQGHVAYLPANANAAAKLAGGLAQLEDVFWDDGDPRPFPRTQMHIVELRAGVAENVVPGSAFAVLNWRNSPMASLDRIRSLVEPAFPPGSSFEWTESARPFLTSTCRLTEAIEEAVAAVCGIKPEPSTGGGTSDARWFAAAGIPVVEFGLVPRRMHGPDEAVAIDEMPRLVRVIEELALRV